MAQPIFTRHLQLQLPKVTSLIFAGAGLYISFVDPHVRKAHRNIPDQLRHWYTVEKKIQWISSGLVIISGMLGINAYKLTKQRLWLWGSLTFVGIFSFTFSALQSINRKLETKTRQYKPGVLNDCDIVQMLKSWVQRHEIRTVMSLIAYGFFYLASSKSFEIDVINP